MTAALERAGRAGEIAPRTARARARLVQASVFGALATARSGARHDAEQALRALMGEVRRWREGGGRVVEASTHGKEMESRPGRPG